MKRILIVDDDTDLLVALKSFLKRKGYDVAASTTCENGYLLVTSFKPDIILLDINIGSEDGREMCKRIKSQAEYQHIPIAFISANREALMTFRDVNANAYLEKPFELSALDDLIRSLKIGN